MRKVFAIRSLLVAVGILLLSAASFAQFGVGVVVSFGPPELPVYEQPICPDDGYIWTPGYWAWDGYDYYWVPGTWVLAPRPGYFWTPAWWGWGGSGFIFHEGYWGPRVGFYGGINYGFGYFGHGYEGGRWEHDHFYYNRTVNNVNVNIIHNTYNTTIVNNYGNSRVSYNGGRGGIEARASREEESAMNERHISPVRAQVQHVQEARNNPEFRSNANHGRPPVAATSRPGAFTGNERVAASEGRGYGSNERPENYSRDPGAAIHPKDLPPNSRLSNPNTGDSGRDRKYQQQQDQLYSRQDRERQQLQQKQEQEHQRYTQQQANQERQQQLDRQHQQQTQQMAQRQYQEQERMQQHQEPQPRESAHNESGHKESGGHDKGKP